MKRFVRPGFYLDITEAELWLLEHAGADKADRWHEALWNTVEFLEHHPLIGRERRDLKHRGVRSWRVKDFERWLIFYLVREDGIIFFRVVSGTIDLPELPFE